MSIKAAVVALVALFLGLRGNASLGLGSTTTTDTPPTGLYKGLGNSTGYGACSATTYDPRQVTMTLQIRF